MAGRRPVCASKEAQDLEILGALWFRLLAQVEFLHLQRDLEDGELSAHITWVGGRRVVVSRLDPAELARVALGEEELTRPRTTSARAQSARGNYKRRERPAPDTTVEPGAA